MNHILPLGAIRKIGELKLNNRLSRKRAQLTPKTKRSQTRVNYDNLIQVEIDQIK